MTISHADIIAVLAAIAYGARTEGEVATHTGWTLPTTGAVLAYAVRHGYLPSIDANGAVNFTKPLSTAARVVLDEAGLQASHGPSCEPSGYVPLPPKARAWLKSLQGAAE